MASSKKTSGKTVEAGSPSPTNRRTAAKKSGGAKVPARKAPGKRGPRKKAPGKKARDGDAPSSRQPSDAPLAATELGAGLKQEAGGGPEETVAGRFYRPPTDIYETPDALFLVSELPGVTVEGLTVSVERGELTVQGRVEVGNYEGLSPVHIEYNVGHFARRFRLPASVDPDRVQASLTDGVLVLELAKTAAHRKRRIEVRPG